LKVQPYCDVADEKDFSTFCADNDETVCGGNCVWKKPKSMCVSGFSGGTEKQNDDTGGGDDVFEDQNAADDSCYGFMPVLDAETGKPKSSPAKNTDDQTAQQFCEGVKDKADNSLCKYTEADKNAGEVFGQCETFNPCAAAATESDCKALEQCEAQVMPDEDGNNEFQFCSVKFLGGDNENAMNDQACFLNNDEGNCKSAEADGRKLCAWTSNSYRTCTGKDGVEQQIGPDDACDGTEKTETNSYCSDICQSSGKDKATCQTAGCCYETVSEGTGVCYAKQGDTCDLGFGFGDDAFASDDTFTDDEADASSTCFQYFAEAACVKESITGGTRSVCMWNSQSFKSCTGEDADCDSKTEEECGVGNQCKLETEDFGYCQANDPCSGASDKTKCDALSSDGCSWQDMGADDGFCIAENNKEAFDGLSTKGTCSFNKNQEDAGTSIGGGFLDENDFADDANSFLGADQCFMLTSDMKTETESEIAAANKTCSQSRDIDGNPRCSFNDMNQASQFCSPVSTGDDPISSAGSKCYNYFDASTCALYGADECEWGVGVPDGTTTGDDVTTGDDTTNGASYSCDEIIVSAVEKCAAHSGEHSCEDVQGCQFEVAYDEDNGDEGGDFDSSNPVDFTDLENGAFSLSDMMGIAAACEAAGDEGAVSCGAVKGKDKDGSEKKLCKFTSTTTAYCSNEMPEDDSVATGTDGEFVECWSESTDGGDESDCAGKKGCEVVSDSYGRCTPLPHKCTTYDADECQKDTDCSYNAPGKGLCLEDTTTDFLEQDEADKTKGLGCRCLADDAKEHFSKDLCEAKGCEFFPATDDAAGNADMDDGMGGGVAMPGGGSDDASASEGQMCSPKMDFNDDFDDGFNDGGADDSYEVFDECTCLVDENADGCAAANAGDMGGDSESLDSMSSCMGLFIADACEAKKTKSGGKSCDWQKSPAQYMCAGSDPYCQSRDRYILETNQLNITACELNSKCTKEKVQDASGFCTAHNPCTVHTGNPSACTSVDGCLYNQDKKCVQDLNDYAACDDTSCCYDVVGSESTCEGKKMTDGSKACQYFKQEADTRSYCMPKTIDAECDLLDKEGVTESQCNANTECTWDAGVGMMDGFCEPYSPCQSAAEDEDACNAVKDAKDAALCLFYVDDETEEGYCVSKEISGATNLEDLTNAIDTAEGGFASGADASMICSLLFTKDKCDNADRGDLLHPLCSYAEDQCIAYDPCRSVKAGESEDSCKDAGCSWTSSDETSGVCKKKLSDIMGNGDFKCVPVDEGAFATEEDAGNIQFSTAAPVTTLDPTGCCMIQTGLISPDWTCKDDSTFNECAQNPVTIMQADATAYATATLLAATTCADATVDGVKLCPQGRTTVPAAVTAAPTEKATEAKPYTLVLPDYRIFITLQNKQGLQVMMADQQSAITAKKLLNAFRVKAMLNLPDCLDYKYADDMFFYRAGGIEIRFPNNIPENCRPDAAMLRAKVRKLNKDATDGRRRRAVTGAKIAFLKVSGSNGKAKSMEAYIAGAADYKFDKDDEDQVLPTAPIPTADKDRTTQPNKTQRKTVPTITRTRTTTTVTTNRFKNAKDMTSTYTETTTTTALVVCGEGTFRDVKTNTCTTCDGPCTTTITTTSTETIDRSLEGLENMLNGQVTLPPTTDNGDITIKEFKDWMKEQGGKTKAYIKDWEDKFKETDKETVSIVDATAEGMDEASFNAIAATSTAGEVKATISTTTIIVMVVIVVILVGSVGLVIYCMKKKLDVTASDPNYVRGGGAAFGNPAYAPAGGAVDEANEGYLDIQEAARNAGKKKGTKKKGGLVRQESLC
jgi:hypothetical protein